MVKQKRYLYCKSGSIFVHTKLLFFISCFMLFSLLFFINGSNAAVLTCAVNTTGSCSSGTAVFYSENDTGGYLNAHVQNVTNSTFPRYNNALCCSSTSTLSNTCSDTTVIRLFNQTNSHVQFGNYSGSLIYNYSVCMSATPGRFVCTYELNTTGSGCVSSGYTCLGSIASSEQSAANQTNAHFGTCSEYGMKVCCKINDASSITNVVLNSTLGTNYTTENLTVYFLQSGTVGDTLTNITDWKTEGVSIAIVNMPFNMNVSTSTSGGVNDYSSWNNDGTLGVSTSMPAWNASGKIGGGYFFDGGDYINISTSSSLNLQNKNFSISFWARSDVNTTYQIVGKNVQSFATGNQGWHISAASSPGDLLFEIQNTSTRTNVSFNIGRIFGWTHFVAVKDEVSLKTYSDGVLRSTTTIIGSNYNVTNQAPLYFGAFNGSSSFFTGAIDEFLLFNRSISAQQITLMYNEGIANKSIRTIVAEETTKGENWSVGITPNSVYDDGTTTSSNTLLVRNSLPTVTLVTPADGNVTTNRTPVFTWSATDADNDILSYQINLTVLSSSGSQASSCNDDRLVSYGTTTYTANPELRWLADYESCSYYKWSVRANDSDGYGLWTSTRTVNVSSLIIITATVDVVNFGSIDLFSFNDTTDDSPPPFILRNDGNSYINVSMNASSLWQTITSTSEYYRFKVDNVSSEAGAFNWSASLTSFTNLSISATTGDRGLVQFNYSDATDSAEVDIYVRVPSAEPPGVKNSTIVFTASLGHQP